MKSDVGEDVEVLAGYTVFAEIHVSCGWMFLPEEKDTDVNYCRH
jgi:hypothetical protein